MNEWTFLFVLNSSLVMLNGDEFGRGLHQEMFILRWRSKHTYTTMRKNARKVAAAHVLARIKAGELVATNYGDRYVIGNANEHHRLVEPMNHSARGFPKLVRLEQPEKYK